MDEYCNSTFNFRFLLFQLNILTNLLGRLCYSDGYRAELPTSRFYFHIQDMCHPYDRWVKWSVFHPVMTLFLDRDVK